MGSSSSQDAVSQRDFDVNRMQFVGNSSDSFSQALDKVRMNRVINGDTSGNATHFVMDHFFAASAFRRCAEHENRK